MRRSRRRPPSLTVRNEVKLISGWPTDTISIDYCYNNHPPCVNRADNDETVKAQCDSNSNNTLDAHTFLLFVPGNPGLCGWYQPLLLRVCQEMGPGYAVRAVSHAGQGVLVPEGGNAAVDANPSKQDMAWTVEGQLRHKLEWVDLVLKEEQDRRIRTQQQHDDTEETKTLPQLIFLTHSLGAFLVQRICVMRRHDILPRTALILHLMPFLRFDPPPLHRWLFSTVARAPQASLTVLRACSRLASSAFLARYVDAYMGDDDDDDNGRARVVQFVQSPQLMTNFLTLGMEEIRTAIPRQYDAEAMAMIGQYCPTRVLLGGGRYWYNLDPWAPYYHQSELDRMVPKNVHATHLPHVSHDFVLYPATMLPPVIDFCVGSIRNLPRRDGASVTVGEFPPWRSRL